ncbi:protein SHI RELATED SEQUENCE 6 isoform X2 [Manihot esculenta]|uniref:Uncharacterized protein n=1 Tax=Manihot esculenta TaxID=3983 RepID=A0ACB7HV07_MANES|nr:protein SHI RELATED SEQUENCE 6 isoform X2 [Manihot esculenta]KAG8656642.1 hypothetical protein MANES_04G159200v8 [Manihot esculenta]
MLGLHNIFLITPPVQPPPPPSSSFHHPDQQPISVHEQCNILNNQDSWTTLKRYNLQESSRDALNIDGDNENCNTSSSVCRDCGNRAKKECEYRRCRTCCKSRGYDCAPHIKSTWVPAARRRGRHATDVGGSSGSSSGGGGGGDGNKRPRENVSATSNSFSTSNNNAAAFFSFDNASNCQDASFKQSLPSQVRAPAVFRCVRVTAISGGEAEVAYQAMVNISGHVFKGFLYDQGIDENNLNRDSTSPIVDPPDPYLASATHRVFQAGNE